MAAFSCTSSLRSQRLNHIDSGCPHRGYHRCSHGRKQQDQSPAGHRQRARSFQIRQESARQLRQRKPAGKADSESGDGHGRAFGDDAHQHRRAGMFLARRRHVPVGFMAPYTERNSVRAISRSAPGASLANNSVIRCIRLVSMVAER